MQPGNKAPEKDSPATFRAAVIAFILGGAVVFLLCYLYHFFTGGYAGEFWKGSHTGIDIGIGVIAGLLVLNFLITNLDRFFNKKL